MDLFSFGFVLGVLSSTGKVESLAPYRVVPQCQWTAPETSECSRKSRFSYIVYSRIV